jgi:hypothetical protein
MQARELIEHSGFSPDDLAVILEGFEDAWAEIGPEVGSDAMMLEVVRLSLARITLEVVSVVPIDRAKINAAAVDAFRAKYRFGGSS